MQKIRSIFVILFLHLASLAQPDHLIDLKKTYPFALLTDDFGILNMDDLKISGCIAVPSDFKTKPFTPYARWQCFESKNVKIICEGNSYDESAKTRFSIPVIKVNQSGSRQEFMGRKVIRLSDCVYFREAMKKLKRGQSHVCISGSEYRSNGSVSVWIFDRFKTKKGCESYFQGDCDLKNFTSSEEYNCEN